MGYAGCSNINSEKYPQAVGIKGDGMPVPKGKISLPASDNVTMCRSGRNSFSLLGHSIAPFRNPTLTQKPSPRIPLGQARFVEIFSGTAMSSTVGGAQGRPTKDPSNFIGPLTDRSYYSK
jgi:hypothetical protein